MDATSTSCRVDLDLRFSTNQLPQQFSPSSRSDDWKTFWRGMVTPKRDCQVLRFMRNACFELTCNLGPNFCTRGCALWSAFQSGRERGNSPFNAAPTHTPQARRISKAYRSACIGNDLPIPPPCMKRTLTFRSPRCLPS